MHRRVVLLKGDMRKANESEQSLLSMSTPMQVKNTFIEVAEELQLEAAAGLRFGDADTTQRIRFSWADAHSWP